MEKITVDSCDIPGLLIFHLVKQEDARGYFMEKFQRAKLIALGLLRAFWPVQQNISYNKEAGVTRGLHAEPWDKFVSVIIGKVFCAFVDLRPGKNYGKKFTIIMDDSIGIFVPKGVANSYQTLVPNVYYSYLVSKHWSSKVVYRAVNIADPELDIQWPIPLEEAIISDKDKKNPLLKDLQPLPGFWKRMWRCLFSFKK